MSKSRGILAAVLVSGFGLAVAGLSFASFNTSASAVEAAPAIVAQKGDLQVPGCADEKWPNISSDCLVAAKGSTVRHARTVTIGYQTGDASSVLVRVPASTPASH